MKKKLITQNKGLSIHELEERLELSITSGGADLEAAKGDRCCMCIDDPAELL